MAAGHVPIETLLAWWLHETDAAATDAVDEHLLRCDACGETLDALVGLAEGVRTAFKAGLVGAIVSGAFVARAAARGHRVREYRLAQNGGVDCTVAPEDELLVPRLSLPEAENAFETSESGLLAITSADWYAYANPGPHVPQAASAIAVWPVVTVETFAVIDDALTPLAAAAPDGRSVTFA